MYEIKLNIKGMMCGGCENRVKNAISEIDGVANVEANYTTGILTVTCNRDVERKIIEETIEDIGYEIVRND